MLAAVLEPGNTTKIWLFGGELTGQQFSQELHVSYSLNSLKGGYIGGYITDYYRGY